ncbi:hypothetical protein HZF05_14560 [Sphingomonas sp. CGMCC 1.13654]|uniref:Uncharacterized protein n=1 Tax=Sphingomonas chungangi TaxID=2683589 RepID=A0A838L8F5_9SPHN|nr:hypothetical protein [Sphingomonas chungangi]MBA2935307.1 hypothetical protein [Sphingomonas chungangi]MVW56814.1 hypothetical protein [Sphingomonas chungangi]
MADRTLAEWEKEWEVIPGGFRADRSHLRKDVGLYCAVQNRRIVFIGRATEWKNGGLAKRIADFSRQSGSARDHHGGERIHDNLDGLELRVLITGAGKEAAEIAKLLCPPMIALHRPAWNVRRRRSGKLKLVASGSPAVAAPTAARAKAA